MQVNAEEASDVSEQYEIEAVPTFLFIKVSYALPVHEWA